MTSKNTTLVNVTLPDALLAQLDAQCGESGHNRSSLIRHLLNKHYNAASADIGGNPVKAVSKREALPKAAPNRIAPAPMSPAQTLAKNAIEKSAMKTPNERLIDTDGFCSVCGYENTRCRCEKKTSGLRSGFNNVPRRE